MMGMQDNTKLEISFPGIVKEIKSSCLVSQARSPNDPDLRRSRLPFLALWDTGATISMISQKVIAACKMKEEGYVAEVRHVGGMDKNVPKFYVNISVKDGPEFHSVQVLRGRLHGFDVLIGMDIISQGDFQVLNGEGKTQFSFSLPADTNKRLAKDTNRNAIKRNNRPPRSRSKLNREKSQ